MIAPYTTIYFRNLGLSFFQIAIIGSAISAGMFLFEVPTGAFADGVSRKYSTLLSFSLCGILFFIFPYFTNFYALVLIWFLMGVSFTFQSGAAESWMIDNLIFNKMEHLKNEFFMKAGIIASAGMVIAPFIGAQIVKYYSIAMLWHILGVLFLISVIILFSAEESYKPKRTDIKNTFLDSIKNSKEGMRLFYTNHALFLIVLAGIFSNFMGMGNEGWQPFLVQLTMPEHYLGYMYSIMALLPMGLSLTNRYLENKKLKYVFTITLLIRMLIILSLILIHPPLYYLAALVFIIDGNMGIFGSPLLESFMHKHIPTKIRATALSVQNMINQGAIFIVALTGGYLLDIFGPQKVIAFSGLFAIFAIMTYWRLEE
jgi:MFS family permease